jgi:uncharacterized phiE125 gp8 family phage protein
MAVPALTPPERLAPVVLPLTIEDARAQCRIVDTVDDARITDAIEDAWQTAESFMERTLLPTRYRARWSVVPCVCFPVLELPRPPLVAVEALEGTDASGAPVTLTLADIVVDTLVEPGTIAFKSGVTRPVALTVTYTAGYASPAAIPGDIRQGLYQTVGAYFDVREDQTESESGRGIVLVPIDARSLWRHYRIVTWA